MQFDLPALPVLLPLWIVGVAMGTAWLGHRNLLSAGRVIAVLLAATYGAAVLAVTLLPLQIAVGRYANSVAWYEKLNFIPILTVDLRTFVLNVVMTVPLGLLASLFVRVPTRGRAALIGVLFSLVIELAQALTNIFLSSGRIADINDLLANAIGAVVGWYVFGWLQRRRWSALLERLTVRAGSLRRTDRAGRVFTRR